MNHFVPACSMKASHLEVAEELLEASAEAQASQKVQREAGDAERGHEHHLARGAHLEPVPIVTGHDEWIGEVAVRW